MGKYCFIKIMAGFKIIFFLDINILHLHLQEYIKNTTRPLFEQEIKKVFWNSFTLTKVKRPRTKFFVLMTSELQSHPRRKARKKSLVCQGWGLNRRASKPFTRKLNKPSPKNKATKKYYEFRCSKQKLLNKL